jgi:hypothetical protein
VVKPTSRKRRGKGRGGLGRVMAAVALAAIGLAMTRGMIPMHLGAFGPLVAILLWLFYTGVIDRRRLEGFHYATAVVTVLASGFLARRSRPRSGSSQGGANGSAGNSRSATVARKSGSERIGSNSDSLLNLAASWKPSATAWRSIATASAANRRRRSRSCRASSFVGYCPTRPASWA